MLVMFGLWHIIRWARAWQLVQHELGRLAQRHPEDAARKACAKTACIEFLVARGAVVEVGASCEKCDHVGIPQDWHLRS